MGIDWDPYGDDTIVAPITPHGIGAVGIVRISGTTSLQILNTLTERGRKVFLPRNAIRVTLKDPETKDPLDTALAIYFPAPGSYTGQDVVEISLHGNPLIIKRVCECALFLGARMARPGEFTRRAFQNGKMDLAQAEAVQEVISAGSLVAAREAGKRLTGDLGKRIRNIRELVLTLMVKLETAIDFPEEEIDEVSGSQGEEELARLVDDIDVLLSSYQYGRALQEGVNIVIAGCPNVGKSSLLNCFLGKKRAIVSPHPGTTRDFISERLNIRGIPLNIIDTAGLRTVSEDPVEEEGLLRSREMIQQSDLVLFVVDGSVDFSADDHEALKALSGERAILVVNKKDLGIKASFLDLMGEEKFMAFTSVSAKTKEGIDELEGQIFHVLSGGEESGKRDVLLGSLRQKEALQRGKECLQRALEGHREKRFLECISLDVKEGAQSLSSLVGEITSEDILEEIFSRFCIGK